MTAKEFWNHQFGEMPSEDSEKLAVTFAATYANLVTDQLRTTISTLEKDNRELRERNDYLENAGFESAFYQNELREKDWKDYDFFKPKKYGKYLCYRKDEVTSVEIWNGTGWTFHNDIITHWKPIDIPTT